MTLIQLGHFGPGNVEDPAVLKQLLNAAFAAFKLWRRNNRVPCSQKRFTPGLCLKACHGAYMTAKAYNGRVITEWLAAVSSDAANSGLYGDQRLPLQAVALRLDRVRYYSKCCCPQLTSKLEGS